MDKQLINSTYDIYQLAPYKYQWAFSRYKTELHNHWSPEEVTMARDIHEWKTEGSLTDAERRMIKRSLGFFVTADGVVANNLVLAIYKNITAPEARLFIAQQIGTEALHQYSYQYCLESLELDENELYTAYHSIASIKDKVFWSLPYMQALSDPSFKTGTFASDQKFLQELIAFYVVFEGIFFYVGFTQMFSLGRVNKMQGLTEQFQLIQRDETNHLNFGVELINGIVQENPHLWTDKFKTDILRMIEEATELEIAYAHDTMPEPMLGLDADMFTKYLNYIKERRLRQIHLGTGRVVENPMPWLHEVVDARKEKNFFEARVTDYKVGGALKW